MMNKLLLFTFSFISVISLMACSPSPSDSSTASNDEESKVAAEVVNEQSPAASGNRQAMIAAEAKTDSWFTTGGQFSEKHYSSLDQINQENVEKLGFAWEYALYTKRGNEATPVIVDGVIYVSGTWGKVYAVDGKTGEKIWRFNPVVNGQVAKDACCDVVNRGVAVWDGLVYVTTLDGIMYALDQKTGDVVWQVDTFAGDDGRKASTGAPRVAGDVVVIGFGGADFNARGYITAYDLKTGEQAWRFYVVPGTNGQEPEHPELEAAAKTWDPRRFTEEGLGGTVWDSMVYDPHLNLLYVGTGNGAVPPIRFRDEVDGDELYVCSILAINPDDGSLVWHYQTTPGDKWDYTSTQNMVLTDMEIDGEQRQVIMQAPKNGFYYILDRVTGELLSAEKYAPVNWATHVDMQTGRPVITEQANYLDGPKVMWPSTKGAHGWRAMAYSEKTGLAYIPVWESSDLKISLFPQEYGKLDEKVSHGMLPLPLSEGVVDLYRTEMPENVDPEKLKELIRNTDAPPERTIIRAWDPSKQETAWEIVMDRFRNSGGVLATQGGLIFHTKPTGELNVYNDETGDLLKSIDTGSGMMGSPATYSIDGEQYVVVMTGLGGGGFFTFPSWTAAYKNGNAGRLLAFKLGGAEVPKPNPVEWPTQPKPPARMGDEQSIAKGRSTFLWNCAICHRNVGAAGMVPNLKYMQPATHEIFNRIVLEGLFAPNGMPSFKGDLTEEEVEDIHAYLIDSAWTLYESGAAADAVDPLVGGR